MKTPVLIMKVLEVLQRSDSLTLEVVSELSELPEVKPFRHLLKISPMLKTKTFAAPKGKKSPLAELTKEDITNEIERRKMIILKTIQLNGAMKGTDRKVLLPDFTLGHWYRSINELKREKKIKVEGERNNSVYTLTEKGKAAVG